MRYIATTSPLVYQKLIESCKYFYIRNPLLVVHEVEVYGKISSVVLKKGAKPLKNVLSSIPLKIWISYKLYLNGNGTDAQVAMTKILRCNGNYITLKNIDLPVKTLSTYVEFAQVTVVDNVNVFYDQDGKTAPLEVVLQCFSSVKDFNLLVISLFFIIFYYFLFIAHSHLLHLLIF